MWLTRIITWNMREYTPVLLGLGTLGLGWVIKNWKRDATRYEKAFALLYISGALFLFAIKSGTWVHRYFSFYLAPSLAVLAVSALSRLYSALHLKAKWARWATAGVVFLFLCMSQPTVAIRYERDGRYPTQNPLIHPPVMSKITEAIYGSRRPSKPIRWVFPEGTSRTIQEHCQVWPDRPECSQYQIVIE
jgi:hypothetical protein